MQLSDIGQTRIELDSQPALFLHCAIFMADGSRVSDEVFRLISFQGQEQISQPFEFHLTLHGNTQYARDAKSATPLKFQDIIGRRVTFGVQRPFSKDDDRDASYLRFQNALDGTPAQGLSLFNGIATAFAMYEPGVYRLTVKPALWKLTLTNRYCVHTQKNIRGAIAEIFARYGITVSFKKLEDSDNLALSRVQDWLQAGEADYEFVQRLMNKAHLFYYIEHGATDHVVVFANRADYPEIPSNSTLRYTETSIEPLGMEQNDVITEYGFEQQLSSTSVEGAFTRQGEGWEFDSVAPFHTFHASAGGRGELPFNLYKIYQYGASEQLAHDFTKKTAEALQSAASQFTGSSHCSTLHPGFKFKAMEQLSRDALPIPARPTLNDQWFVVTQIQHEASLDGTYRNQFSAAEAETLISPVSLQDTQQGTVLAKVVPGPGSQATAPNDWRYCTKNNFDPEPSIATDSTSMPSVTSLTGVYVEFSNEPGSAIWIKLAAHMQTAPEIGAMVIVARSNDESEMPEIQNTISSSGHMTVTPSRWIPDTRVGSSYSTTYGDGMSMQFGKNSSADVPRAVGILRREYASGDFRDVGYSQGARYSYDTSEKGKQGILSKSESYGSTYSHSEAAEHKSYDDVGYSRNEQHIGNSDNYSTTTGRSFNDSKTGESESHNLIERDNKNYETIKGKNYSESIFSSTENHSTTNGTSNSYETNYGARYSESVSKSTVENHSTVDGKNSSYETYNGNRYSESTTNGDSESVNNVTGTDKNTSNVGISTRNSATGINNDNSVVGISNSNSLVGLQNSNSLVGASADIRISGAANQLNVSALSSNINVAAASLDITSVGTALSVSLKGETVSVDVVGASTLFESKPAAARVEMIGPDISLLSAIKLIL